MIIIGAGLSGLIAATQFQSATVHEAKPFTADNHHALLRFRSPAVGDAVGIEFKQVRVHKGIWDSEVSDFAPPSIRLANLYSMKVLRRLGDRSIWNLDPVDRWVAPNDLMDILAQRMFARIHWDSPIDLGPPRETDWARRSNTYTPEPNIVISTMPLPTLVKQLALRVYPSFSFAPIHVSRFRIEDADVHQTIYFPNPDSEPYRASITGDLLIIEGMQPITGRGLEEVLYAFGLDQVSEPLGASSQQFGKIAPVDDAWRRKFILEATQRLGVYSLGRFAVWRNILADDVLHDITVIKRLLKGDAYGHSLKA